MQGESDSTNEAKAASYGADLETFIAALRSDLHAPAMPVVIGRIADLARFDRRFAFSAEVREQQAAVAAAGLSTYLVSTDDLQRSAWSPVHFSPAGIVELGRRFADAMPR